MPFDLRFESPYWLLALAVVALGSLGLLLLRQTGSWPQPAVLFANLATLKRQGPTWRVRARKILVGINLLVLALVTIAMARPQKGRSDSVILSEGIDIVMVVDTSGSMAAQDFGGNRTRLYHATQVMQEFVKRRKNDRIGLISFGRHAYTRCPMTLDYGLLDRFFNYVHDEWARAYDSLSKKSAMDREPRLTPQELDLQGTAIGDAIVGAVSRLDDSKTKTRIIILLTDGESNYGETQPVPAAELAKQLGVKIYTIGAGSNERVPVRAYDPFGRAVTKLQQFPLDEETLRSIAETTGGRYFRASDRAQLEVVLGEIDHLERSEVKVRDYREWDERFPLLLYAALGLLLLDAILAATVLRIIP